MSPHSPVGQTAGSASQQNYISAPGLDLCYWDQGYNQPTVSYCNQDGPDSQSSGLQVRSCLLGGCCDGVASFNI